MRKKWVRSVATCCAVALTAPAVVADGLAALDTLAPGTTFQDCAVCPLLIVVPPGAFTMGSTAWATDAEGHMEDEVSDERPRRAVTVTTALAVARYETTRAEFSAFAEATDFGAKPDCWVKADGKGQKLAGRDWKNPGSEQSDRHPVICVDWDDATAYSQWLAEETGSPYRLPTEAEWEYFGRAGTTTVRFWGDDPEESCRYGNGPDVSVRPVLSSRREIGCNDGFARTAPVGAFLPNAFGLYDVMGNVWEWVADCYYSDWYSRAEVGSSAKAPDAPGCRRGMRGGSWSESLLKFRTSARGKGDADVRGDSIGIRVVRDLTPELNALTDRGNRYLRGDDGEQNDHLAFDSYRRAAALGLPRAQHNLGYLYAQGRGVGEDAGMAVRWYREAAARGYLPAITSLGLAYREGRGLSVDPDRGLALLQRAASAGDERAAKALRDGGNKLE